MRRWISLLVPAMIVALLVVVVIALVFRPFYRVSRAIHASQAAMQMPENFRPAEQILARMCQSDPRIFEADKGEMPPNWTPPEIGKLIPHFITVKPDGARVDMGSGFIDN